ncbi:alpha/beta fold hydrolase [bacterium]|nr:alpha/beta fold hydrolase [bacterium]
MTSAIAADLLPYVSSEIVVDGHFLRYLDEGDSDQTLLCVHGNPTWSFYYRRVVERFAKTHRVVAVDHLGCGRSEKPDSSQFSYRFSDHRDNLVTLIEELDLRNITLVAHDWGGAIGLSSLLRTQERFRGIVLLNTAAFVPPYIPLRISACRFPWLGTLAVRGLNLFAASAIRMAMSRNRLSADAARGLLAPYDNWKHRVAIDRFVKDIPMSSSHPTFSELEDLGKALPQLSGLPSLLVWGMKDWCFRPECLRRFEAVWPDAKVLEIADAGHYVIEDAPDETIDAINSFLSRS